MYTPPASRIRASVRASSWSRSFSWLQMGGRGTRGRWIRRRQRQRRRRQWRQRRHRPGHQLIARLRRDLDAVASRTRAARRCSERLQPAQVAHVCLIAWTCSCSALHCGLSLISAAIAPAKGFAAANAGQASDLAVDWA